MPHADVRVVSVGVGEYPEPIPRLFSRKWLEKRYVNAVPYMNLSVSLVQKTFEINTRSLDQLRAVLYKDIKTVRISDAFTELNNGYSSVEHDLTKLNILRQRGRNSFAKHEATQRGISGATGMTIPEAQLDTWSPGIGAVAESRDTYATIKNALEVSDAAYDGKRLQRLSARFVWERYERLCRK